ncbi:MAG: hypothetical protein K6G12_02825 [Lachnospiraceae bacterium]|nr:hypothetical protein [Lachnospiraceae bacterium]
MDKYLTILIDSLVKKSALLDKISDICSGHEECLFGEKLDIDEYNRLMEEKGKLIDDLDLLDDGFTALYERVAPTLREDPSPYAEKIKKLQELITEVSDKTALIQAREMRIQSRIDRLVKFGKEQSKPTATPSDAAMKYYRTMKNTNVTSAVFVDNKRGKK